MKNNIIKKSKKGISLVALVITIIVMIILATTVMVGFNKEGIVDKAKEAVFKNDFKVIEESFYLNQKKIMLENKGNNNINDSAITQEGLKEYIPIIDENKIEDKKINNKRYIDLIQIYKGDIYQSDSLDDDEIKRMLNDIGIQELKKDEIDESYKEYIYIQGDKKEALTGGWSSSYNGYGIRQITSNDNHIYFKASNTANNGQYGAHVLCSTRNKIDITNYSKLFVKVKEINITNSLEGDVLFGLKNTKVWDNYGYRDFQKYIATVISTSEEIIFEVDISDEVGEYYIVFQVNASAGPIREVTAKLDSVWFE